MSATPATKLLLRLPSHLGDLVMAEPLLRALDDDRGFDSSLLGPARLFELFEGRFPRLARLPLANRASERPALYRGFERVLLLNGAWRSAWCAFAAGIPERHGLGSNLRAPLLTHPTRPAREVGLLAGRPLPRPFGSVCVELALHAGLEVRERVPRLQSTAAGERLASARLAAAGLAPDRPFLLVHAGARAGSSKGFVPRHLAAILAEVELPVLLACAPGEEAAAEETRALVARRDVHLGDPPAVGLAELVELARRCAALLSTDGGARHVGTAAGAPAVVLYGPTDRRHTAEHGPHERGLAIEVDCGPCHRERCSLPGADERRCLSGIEPARVLAALREVVRARE